MILIRLKQHQLFNGVARMFSYTQAWAPEEGAGISKFSKKAVFLVLSDKKQISPLLTPCKSF